MLQCNVFARARSSDSCLTHRVATTRNRASMQRLRPCKVINVCACVCVRERKVSRQHRAPVQRLCPRQVITLSLCPRRAAIQRLRPRQVIRPLRDTNREFFTDNLLVRSLTSTFQCNVVPRSSMPAATPCLRYFCRAASRQQMWRSLPAREGVFRRRFLN